MDINNITTVDEWYEHRDLVVKALNKMQWEYKQDLQKMNCNLIEKHKEIQLLEHEVHRRPTVSLNEKVEKERKIFIYMLKVFNQHLMIARLTSIGKS